ncbi:MAG: monomethylamine:corrinoid methyltransferase [Candidatus Bathyarchaeia archaeon]
MISFIEIVDRAYNIGEYQSPKEFDMMVFNKASTLAKEYDIKFDPNCIIPADDTLADDLYEAGFNLFLELGVLFTGTNRVIKFNEQEIKEFLKEIKPSIKIGSGNEERVIKKRNLEECKKPSILGGVIEGNPQECEIFFKLYQGISQIKKMDGIYYGPPETIMNKLMRHNTPLEFLAVSKATEIVREANKEAGRPGLHLICAAHSAIGDVGAYMAENGIGKSDAIAIPVIAELKADEQALNKTAFALKFGIITNPYRVPIIGGYAGGPEGAAIVGVAEFFQSLTIYQGYRGYFNWDVIRAIPPGGTSREALWARSIVGQAIQKNTNAISGSGIVTFAGPGTEMMLYEIAAATITHTVSGLHVMHGCRKARLTKPNHCTPLEPAFEAEVAYASTKLKREDANEIIKSILEKYEKYIQNAPEGYSFNELFDIETLKPKSSYTLTLNLVKDFLQDIGLNIEETALERLK